MSQYSGIGSTGQLLSSTQNSLLNQHQLLTSSEDDTSKLLDYYDRVSSGTSHFNQSTGNDDSVDRKKKLLEKLNQDVLAEYEEARQSIITSQQNYRSLVERFLTFASENKQIYTKTLQLYEEAYKEFEKSNSMTNLQMPMHLRLIVNVSLLYMRADQSSSLTKLLIKSPYVSFQAFEDAIGEIWKSQTTKVGPPLPKLGICGWLGRHHVTPRGLSSTMINTLVAVEGVVNKCSGVYPKLSTSVYVGEDLLDVFNETEKSVYIRNHYDLTDLNKTRVDTTMPPPVDPQGKLVYRQEVGLSNFKNYQTFVLQETPEDSSLGQMPRYVSVIVQDDLCNRVKCGDRVRIWGVYRMLTPNSANTSTIGSSIGKPFLVANHLLIKDQYYYNNNRSGGTNTGMLTDEDRVRFKYLASRNDTVKILTNSVAPSICGLSLIKKGILLQLVGGHLNNNNVNNNTQEEQDQTQTPGGTIGRENLRGDIHVLLVGDPGCGKSQLLRFVMALFPNTVSTTGRGSTGVGLTAAVIQDEETGERRVEGGAMVMGDRKVVLIDEFDKMNYSDRVAIHEVMEQQTVSVAKAGIHTTLNARCTVLAAANPLYGCWSEDMQINDQLNFEYSLLSRFDLIFIVRDANNEVQDDRISDAILRNITQKARPIKVFNKLNKTSVIQPTQTDLLLQVQYTIQSTSGSTTDNNLNLASLGASLENSDNQDQTGTSRRVTRRTRSSTTNTDRMDSDRRPDSMDGMFSSDINYLDEEGVEHEILDLVTLNKYICYCKDEFYREMNYSKGWSNGPELSIQARNEISRAYSQMRQRSKDNKKKLLQLVSPRTLEAIVRLSTAFAKLKLSRYITRQHVKAAVKLLNYTIFGDLYTSSKKSRKKDDKSRSKEGREDDDFSSSSSDGEFEESDLEHHTSDEEYLNKSRGKTTEEEQDTSTKRKTKKLRKIRSTSKDGRQKTRKEGKEGKGDEDEEEVDLEVDIELDDVVETVTGSETSQLQTTGTTQVQDTQRSSQSVDKPTQPGEVEKFGTELMKHLQKLDFGDGVEVNELYLAYKAVSPVSLNKFKKLLAKLSSTENAPIVYAQEDQKVYTC